MANRTDFNGRAASVAMSVSTPIAIAASLHHARKSRGRQSLCVATKTGRKTNIETDISQSSRRRCKLHGIVENKTARNALAALFHRGLGASFLSVID